MDREDAESDLSDHEEQPRSTTSSSTAHIKRHLQEQAFNNYVHARVNTKDFYNTPHNTGRLEDEDGDELPGATSDTTPIINTPRDYQLELFERAKTENLIAVLDTGSGKTLIAVLLLRWTLDQELQARAAGSEPKIAFFVVSSVNLVVQQSSVLKANLTHPTKDLFGAMNVDTWSKPVWQNLFARNRVIVCTADILRDCLDRNYLDMKQINLLILDEAHHTKKSHAYARIISQHYATTIEADRPRVFAMTASPVDTKGTDFARAAVQLENLLHSRIVTSSMSSLTSVNAAEDKVLSYQPPPPPTDSSLVRQLSDGYAHLDHLVQLIDRARNIAKHLGAWCGDRYLFNMLTTSKRQRLMAAVQQSMKNERYSVGEIDLKLAGYDQAIAVIEHSASEKAVEYAKHSPKVQSLIAFLTEHFSKDSASRCLVFVKEKVTARLLALVLQGVHQDRLKADFLVGGQSGNLIDDYMTTTQAKHVLKGFRTGKLNCLFTTSVAEEGLDIPQCNLVVRFDLYNTMVQYIQSRGRARRKNSTFVHMVEAGNSIQSGLVKTVLHQEKRMREFCASLPEERKLLSTTKNDDLAAKEEQQVYYDPVSGAKLNTANAMVYLANLVSVMPTTSGEPQHPTYATMPYGNKFVAEVLLPPGSPIRSIRSKPCSQKKVARSSAAFAMCVELRNRNYLDEYFVPIYVKQLPAMRNALLAVGMKAKTAYPMITKPAIWSQQKELPTVELWVTVLSFRVSANSKYMPLAFITRSMMPRFPAIPLFAADGMKIEVTCSSSARMTDFSEERYSDLASCTFRIFKDVFSKTYEQKAADLPYFLAPAIGFAFDETVKDTINWSLVKAIVAAGAGEWTESYETSALVDKLLTDPLDGSRKLVVTAIAPNMRPTDPVPSGVVKSKWMDSIIDYSFSLWNKNARAQAQWSDQQPVLITQRLAITRNLLMKPVTKTQSTSALEYVCPEPLRISPIPPSMARSSLAWPSIIWKLESVLMALEACDELELHCQPQLALAAITKDTVESDEDGSTLQENGGMGENYERLEFLGDTFLKLATSLSIFIRYPHDNEFEFHVKRMVMLCNQNLYDVSIKLKLTKYIRAKAFQLRLWYPEGLNLLAGKGTGMDSVARYHSQQQHLSDKTIADVSEALIGAAFLTHNAPGHWTAEQWTDAVKAVTKLVDSSDHTMLCWQDYKTAYEPPAYQLAESTASQRDMAEQIALVDGYHFRSATLLRSAFLHASYPQSWENLPHYERLEFLGDALLDMVFVSHIFYGYPDKDPSWLTEAKMVMVSNSFLGMICCTLGFHKHIRHNSSAFEAQIREYAADLEEARAQNTGVDFWMTITDPPKCLADVVEAYVAAMFLDSDFDFGQVQRFFDQHMKGYLEDMSIYAAHTKTEPMRAFFKVLQNKFGCSGGRALNKDLPGVDSMERRQLVAGIMIHDSVVAHSTGVSMRYAGARAAKKALHVLDKLSLEDFRLTYRCACKGVKQGDARMDREDKDKLEQIP